MTLILKKKRQRFNKFNKLSMRATSKVNFTHAEIYVVIIELEQKYMQVFSFVMKMKIMKSFSLFSGKNCREKVEKFTFFCTAPIERLVFCDKKTKMAHD